MATEETKTKIVETAIDMFNTRGYKGVTMDDVAAKLHISKRTIYEIFASKDELVLECLTKVHQIIGRMRLEAFSKTGEPLLTTLFIMRNAVKQQSIYWRLLDEAERYYPELNAQLLKSFGNKFKGSLRIIFEEAAKRGDLRENIDLETAMDVIIESIRHGSHSINADKNAQSERSREACFTYLRGLLSVDAIKRYDIQEEEFRKKFEN